MPGVEINELLLLLFLLLFLLRCLPFSSSYSLLLVALQKLVGVESPSSVGRLELLSALAGGAGGGGYAVSLLAVSLLAVSCGSSWGGRTQTVFFHSE